MNRDDRVLISDLEQILKEFDFRPATRDPRPATRDPRLLVNLGILNNSRKA